MDFYNLNKLNITFSKFPELLKKMKDVKIVIMDNDTITKNILKSKISSWKNFCSSKKMRVNYIPLSKSLIKIYTSGTTGKPKKVALTGYEIMSNVHNISNKLPEFKRKFNNCVLKYENERIMSYLPLNHISGQMFEIYLSLIFKSSVCFFTNNNNLIKNIKICTPTLFLATPLFWNNINDEILSIKSSGSIITIPFMNIKKDLGLEQCKYFFNSGAKLDIEIKRSLFNCGIKIYEIYGLTELGGILSVQTPKDKCKYCIGTLFNNIKYKIHNKQLHILKKSKWINTNDIIKIGKKNKMWYIGRKDDTIVLTNGSNINLLTIESTLRSHIPILDDVIIIGANKPYLSLICTLKVKNKTVNLHDTVLKEIKEVKSSSKTIYDAIDDKKIKIYIQNKINEYNLGREFNSEKIVNWALIENFSYKYKPSSFKLLKNKIKNDYSSLINKLYDRN